MGFGDRESYPPCSSDVALCGRVVEWWGADVRFCCVVTEVVVAWWPCVLLVVVLS